MAEAPPRHKKCHKDMQWHHALAAIARDNGCVVDPGGVGSYLSATPELTRTPSVRPHGQISEKV